MLWVEVVAGLSVPRAMQLLHKRHHVMMVLCSLVLTPVAFCLGHEGMSLRYLRATVSGLQHCVLPSVTCCNYGPCVGMCMACVARVNHYQPKFMQQHVLRMFLQAEFLLWCHVHKHLIMHHMQPEALIAKECCL